MAMAIKPIGGNILIHTLLKQKPDLWGPFWISTTWVLMIGVISLYQQSDHVRDKLGCFECERLLLGNRKVTT